MSFISETLPFTGDMLADRATHEPYVRSLGVDPDSNDDTQFAVQFIYCDSHMRGHHVGWCTVRNVWKVPLETTVAEDVADECRERGYLLYDDVKVN